MAMSRGTLGLLTTDPAFLTALFGHGESLVGESAIYSLATRFCPDYRGGLWNHVQTPAGARYMRPRGDQIYRLERPARFAVMRLSADGAGIALTLLALKQIGNWTQQPVVRILIKTAEATTAITRDNFLALYEAMMAAEHPDRFTIQAFLDT